MTKKSNKDSKNYMLMDSSTPFAIREAINHLRTNITYMPSNDDGCPVFAITSAIESVGKSTSIANLALSFAQVSKKVLLIDADIRRPVISNFFNIDKKHHGLTELISGIEKNDGNVIVEYTEAPALHVLTSGFIPQNPADLIFSKKFGEYLKKWKYEYDIILIDFPPIGIVTDALSVASDITGYFVAIRANHSDHRNVNNAISILEQANAKVLGVILNDLSLKSGGGTRNYSYSKVKYGYYYNTDKN